MLSNCESTTSHYYVMFGAGAGAVFFSGSGSGKKVPKSRLRLRLHNAVHQTKFPKLWIRLTADSDFLTNLRQLMTPLADVDAP